jgi:two-component system, NarL family, nitrate/nitrite response regulator NarL
MDVLLVDDHPIIHETLRAILRSVRADASFHGQFDLASGLSHAGRLEALELVLLDLALPGCSGMDAFFSFRTAHPSARVAVISASEDAEKVHAALQAGAAGYLPKTLMPKAMADAIRVILDGGVYSPLGSA